MSNPRSVSGHSFNTVLSEVVESNWIDQSSSDTQGLDMWEDKSDQRFDGCVTMRGCSCLTSISG